MEKSKIRPAIPWCILFVLVVYGTWRDGRVMKQLEGRKQWMNEITQYLERRTADRWTRAEHLEFVNSMRELNPGMSFPIAAKAPKVKDKMPVVPE